ncbi:unnamed protein product [Meloidogyne enterolobii]|uniref:Uncharacterized protein n=1 Tax=Meloidogyne enterolobii TaxID=390850 RepID=A0ACB1AW25_MELEN
MLFRQRGKVVHIFWGGCGKCDPSRHCFDCKGRNCNTADKFKNAFYCYEGGDEEIGNSVCQQNYCYIYVDSNGKIIQCDKSH